jgi:hypothetical protein
MTTNIDALPALIDDLKVSAARMRDDAKRFATSIGTTVEALRALLENERPAINAKWHAWVEAGKR